MPHSVAMRVRFGEGDGQQTSAWPGASKIRALRQAREPEQERVKVVGCDASVPLFSFRTAPAGRAGRKQADAVVVAEVKVREAWQGPTTGRLLGQSPSLRASSGGGLPVNDKPLSADATCAMQATHAKVRQYRRSRRVVWNQSKRFSRLRTATTTVAAAAMVGFQRGGPVNKINLIIPPPL